MWDFWRRVALVQVFPRVLRFFPISIILTVLHAHLFINSFIHSAITNTTKSQQLTALLNKTHKHTQTSLSQHSCPGIGNCMSLKTIGLIAIFYLGSKSLSFKNRGFYISQYVGLVDGSKSSLTHMIHKQGTSTSHNMMRRLG